MTQSDFLKLLGRRAIIVSWFRQRLAVDNMQSRVEQQHKARATGINHTSIFQNRQQLWSVLERFLPRRTSNTQHRRQSRAVICCTLRRISGFAHHSQNCAFNWFENCFVCSG